ncbi:MAG: hypothetical protein ACYTDY_20370, partial [Planctomycetota bacterium]
MPNVPEWKKKKAYLMRLARRPFSAIARECHMSTKTIQLLEKGWTDKAGVFHPGWKDDLEKQWEEEDQSEHERGLALKKRRIEAYERLALQAIEVVEKQFPNIKMKSASDAKALLSEIRELCRLISIERGEYRPGGGPLVAVKAEITMKELRDRYEAAKQVEVEEIPPPEKPY